VFCVCVKVSLSYLFLTQVNIVNIIIKRIYNVPFANKIKTVVQYIVNKRFPTPAESKFC